MKKIWIIAWKDTLVRMRDYKAIIGFILTPILLAAVMGTAFGSAFRGENPLQDIPILIINEDEGGFGEIYADAFALDSLSELFSVTFSDELETAQAQIGAGEYRGLIYIQPGFSKALLSNLDGEVQAVLVITDPAASVSPYILQSVVAAITAQINTALSTAAISAEQAVEYAPLLGTTTMQELVPVIEAVLDDRFADETATQISLNRIEVGEADEDLNPFGVFAPAMAIFFLMYSMMDGTRSILQEETNGTLPRLISTPTSLPQIILGKMGGVIFTGILQFLVMVFVSQILFDLYWGPPLAVALLVFLTVFAAASMGALIASFAKNENQAGIIGSAVSLLFAALGGNFAQASALPAFLQPISKLTINRWALDGFIDLTLGQAVIGDLWLNFVVLAGMTMLFFGLAAVLFQRRFVR